MRRCAHRTFAALFPVFQVQFCILLVHNAIPILMPDCGVQKVWCMILVAQNVFMFSMFYDFYQRTYSENKKLA